ncbi:MAG: PilZ domain-containing protein [Pseudodesulfovibrio sp.]|nr:PilZ domain-containing protein [Pseudodesulfovibrio sp.]
MGLFDIISNFFSKSGKGTPGKKNATSKKVAKKGISKKKKKAPTEETNVSQSSKTKPVKEKRKKSSKNTTSDNLLISISGKGNKRKKTKTVHAAPIDEAALGFSISLKGEDTLSKNRNAMRISVKNLTVHVSRLNKQFPVTDISATGLGFDFEKPRVKSGVKLKMNIYLDGKNKVSEVMCKVMRHERGSVGCVFEDLDRTQDDAIHEIVLLGQKQQAARKAAQKDRNFKLPN